MEYYEIVGWLSGACFAICALPQALESFKTKQASGVNSLFLWLWYLGEIFGIFYVLPRFDVPLLTNYFCNSLLILVIMYYKFKGEQNGK